MDAVACCYQGKLQRSGTDSMDITIEAGFFFSLLENIKIVSKSRSPFCILADAA